MVAFPSSYAKAKNPKRLEFGFCLKSKFLNPDLRINPDLLDKSSPLDKKNALQKFAERLIRKF